MTELEALREVEKVTRYIQDNILRWYLQPQGAALVKEAFARQVEALNKLDEVRKANEQRN